MTLPIGLLDSASREVKSDTPWLYLGSVYCWSTRRNFLAFCYRRRDERCTLASGLADVACAHNVPIYTACRSEQPCKRVRSRTERFGVRIRVLVYSPSSTPIERARRWRAGRGMTRHPRMGAVERRLALSVNFLKRLMVETERRNQNPTDYFNLPVPNLPVLDLGDDTSDYKESFDGISRLQYGVICPLAPPRGIIRHSNRLDDFSALATFPIPHRLAGTVCCGRVAVETIPPVYFSSVMVYSTRSRCTLASVSSLSRPCFSMQCRRNSE
jgi:hypothetical protein